MSIDYVICNKENFTTQLIIELDGESHNTNDQQQQDRDKFKNKALDKAGIKIMRVITQKTYNTKQLREELHRYIDIEPNTPTVQPPPQVSHQKENVCTSPDCNGTMKIRADKSGKNYWVCSEYNKCKTAMAVEEAGA